jgi:hypothetical protein
LITIAAAIPTSLGGGNHGHAGIIVDNAKYLPMTGGIQFITPINLGAYPTNIAGNVTNAVCSCKEAMHKTLVREYEIYCRVKQALKDIILETVEKDYLLEIEDVRR